ncbi:unnamed protein product [Closterium sp. Yama58-4]|nr:unnamed protein product [Closterium sp. Yama58-4]
MREFNHTSDTMSSRILADTRSSHPSSSRSSGRSNRPVLDFPRAATTRCHVSMLLDQLEERCRLAAQTRQRYYRSSSCTRDAPPNQQIQPYHYPPSWREPWLVGSFGPRLEARFEVGEELGRGHFGVVRACRERGSGATFACKTISKELLQGSRAMEELRAEALTPLLLQQMAEEEEDERARDGEEVETVNSVNPVNSSSSSSSSSSTGRSPWEGLVRLHSVYEDNSGVHLVMDHCSGGDLFDLVDRYAESAGMPEQLAAAVVGQLAATLAWMHSVGVVHRDLKPENILLARPFSGDASSLPNLHLCVADFGLARRLAPGEHLTGLVGSPFYLAPEVVKGHLYNHQVDVWSLGIIMYTCLSGKLPFHGPNHNAVFAAACRATPDLVSPELWGGVSAEAKDLVRRMLEKEPGRRMRSCEILSHPWFETVGRRNLSRIGLMTEVPAFGIANSTQRPLFLPWTGVDCRGLPWNGVDYSSTGASGSGTAGSVTAANVAVKNSPIGGMSSPSILQSQPWHSIQLSQFQPASSQPSQPTASHQSSQPSQPSQASQPSQQDQSSCAQDTIATLHLTTTPTPQVTANTVADPNHITTPPQDHITAAGTTSSHSPMPPRPTPARPLSICPPPPPSPHTLATSTTPTPRTPSRALSARPRKPANQSPRPTAPSPPALPPSLLSQLRADRVADLMRLFRACQAGSSDDVARCQGSTSPAVSTVHVEQIRT